MSRAKKIKYYLESIHIQTELRNEARRNGNTEEEIIAQNALNDIIAAFTQDIK